MEALPHPAESYSRDQPVDALRGLAIILVVLGHAIEVAAPTSYESLPLHVIIYSFHLPLFAFLSGFLTFRSRHLTAGRFIARRAQALLIPYFAWLTVWWTLSEIRGGASAPLPQTIAMAAINPRTENALWFFYVLFECCVLFALATRMGRSRSGLIISVVAALIAHAYQIGWTLQAFDLRRVELLYPFFVFGFLAAQADIRSRIGSRTLLVCIAGYAATMALVWPDANKLGWPPSALTTCGNFMRPLLPVAHELTALLAALMAIIALLRVYDTMHNDLIRPQAWFGQRSLGIYASHKRVIYLVVELGLPGFILPAVVSLAVAAVVTVMLSTNTALSVIFLGKPNRRAS